LIGARAFCIAEHYDDDEDEDLEHLQEPKFSFLLDESVIHRLVGGLATTSQQLRHLISRAELPNVTIRIVPFTAGIHPGMKGPFELIQFADTSDENIVFREITSDDSISDDPGEAQNYLDALTRITAVSLSPSDAVDRLRKAGFAATCRSTRTAMRAAAGPDTAC
jgi:Domain of unknown function (DUF5753)